MVGMARDTRHARGRWRRPFATRAEGPRRTVDPEWEDAIDELAELADFQREYPPGLMPGQFRGEQHAEHAPAS
jgi:hypothetical protein